MNRWRPKKAFRQRDWFREVDALDLLPRWLVRAATVEEIDKRIGNMKQIVAHCQALVETEARVAATIDNAQTKADTLRQRSARLQGTAFKLAEHRHHAIKDECNHARRAKDARAEEAALNALAQKLQSFEGLITRAEAVTAAIPQIEARIAAIKPEEIWLDGGAKETYDDLLATFAETQRDIKRGDYDKAAQRCAKSTPSKPTCATAAPAVRTGRNRKSPCGAPARPSPRPFRNSAQFPPKLSTADIENLYAYANKSNASSPPKPPINGRTTCPRATLRRVADWRLPIPCACLSKTPVIRRSSRNSCVASHPLDASGRRRGSLANLNNCHGPSDP